MKGQPAVHSKQEIIRDIQRYIQTDIINSSDFSVEIDTDIIRGGLIDSMGIVRLMVHLQQRYEIEDFERTDINLDNFRTIDRIASMVMKYRSAAPAVEHPPTPLNRASAQRSRA